MNFKAVIFDLDGTVADTVCDLANCVNYVLNKHNFPMHPTSKFKYFAGDGILTMIKRALPENTPEKTVQLIKNEFFEYYSMHYCDNTRPFDGLVQMIENLKSYGMKVAVVTNKEQTLAEKVVGKLYGNAFDLVYGMREGIPGKPDPTLTLMAMNELNVKPEECAFVGDTSMDIMAGVNSGAYPVGVLWGFRTKEEILSSGAKAVAENAKELEKILKGQI